MIKIPFFFFNNYPDYNKSYAWDHLVFEKNLEHLTRHGASEAYMTFLLYLLGEIELKYPQRFCVGKQGAIISHS